MTRAFPVTTLSLPIIRAAMRLSNARAVSRIAGLYAPCRVLDAGAGRGTLLDGLRDLGFNAHGFDLYPKRADVLQADAHSFAAEVGSGFDLVCSVNMLEHIPRPREFMAQARLVAPRLYLAFTPWCSPYGGHEFSPLHFFGATRGTDHELGVNLFRTSADMALRDLRACGWRVRSVRSRYWPAVPFLHCLPGRLKDFAMWNVEITAERDGSVS